MQSFPLRDIGPSVMKSFPTCSQWPHATGSCFCKPSTFPAGRLTLVTSCSRSCSLELHSTSVARESAASSGNMFLLLQNGFPLQPHQILAGSCFLGVSECRANMAHPCVIQHSVSGFLDIAGHHQWRYSGWEPMHIIL